MNDGFEFDSVIDMMEVKEHAVGLVWKDVELDLEAIDMQNEDEGIDDTAGCMFFWEEDAVNFLQSDDESDLENVVESFEDKEDADFSFWKDD